MISQRKMDAIRLMAEDRIGRIMAKALEGYLGDRRFYNGNLSSQDRGQPFGDSEEEWSNPTGVIEGESGYPAGVGGSELGIAPQGGGGYPGSEIGGGLGQVLPG